MPANKVLDRPVQNVSAPSASVAVVSRVTPPPSMTRMRCAQVLRHAGKVESCEGLLDEVRSRVDVVIGWHCPRCSTTFARKKHLCLCGHKEADHHELGSKAGECRHNCGYEVFEEACGGRCKEHGNACAFSLNDDGRTHFDAEDEPCACHLVGCGADDAADVGGAS